MPPKAMPWARRVRVRNATTGRPVCEAGVAETAWSRARGLIGRPPLDAGMGLLIDPCRGVHTFFMRVAIDVIFLDADGRVVSVRESLRPWRMTRIYAAARTTLELAAGQVAVLRIAPGHVLTFEPVA